MKYELYFLNNIFDSFDAVNVELDSFFDLAERENHFEAICIKRIVVNLANCCELLVKYRLEEEHWVLVFSDIDKTSCESYKNGDFISVHFKEGINRLQRICEVKCDFAACKNIYRHRNSLMHYTLSGTYELILKDISGAMYEIVEFMKNEIVALLPFEATEDFTRAIKEYTNNARKIDEVINKIVTNSL